MRIFQQIKGRKLYGNEWFTLFIIVVAGLYLRVHNLGKISLWYDELCTFCRIDYPFFEVIANLRNSPFPPLYYVTLKIWTMFFGISECTLRFPSVVFSSLSIVFIYVLAKELFNKDIGLIAALLLCISPYSINYAQEAKMYSMLWFFGLASFLFFYRKLKHYSQQKMILYFAFTLLSVYTHYAGFLFMVVHNILFFIFSDKKHKKAWILVQLAIILFYVPWLKFCLSCIHSKTGISWVANKNPFWFLGSLLRNVLGTSIGRNCSLELLIYFLLIGIALLSLFAKMHKGKSMFMPALANYYLLILWIIVPVGIYMLIDHFYTHILVVRYMGFIHIPLIILLGRAIDGFKTFLKIGLLAFIIIITFGCHLYPYYTKEKKINARDFRGLSNQLRKIANKEDVIYTTFAPARMKFYSKEYCFKEWNKMAPEGKKYFYVVYKKAKEKDSLKEYQIDEVYEFKGEIGIMRIKNS